MWIPPDPAISTRKLDNPSMKRVRSEPYGREKGSSVESRRGPAAVCEDETGMRPLGDREGAGSRRIHKPENLPRPTMTAFSSRKGSLISMPLSVRSRFRMTVYNNLRIIPLFILLAFLCVAGSACENLGHADETNTAKAPGELRIISQLPNVTEICFALGLGKQLVGVTTYCLYPKETAEISKIGGIINPDFERVLALQPDLLIIQDTQKELKSKYDQLGIKTLVVKSWTIQNVLDSITAIGQATGREKEAMAEITRMQSAFEGIRKLAAARKPVRTLFLLGHDPGSLREIYAAGQSFFHGELLEMAGGKNVIAKGPIIYPKLSKEEILRQVPEVIIVMSDQEPSAEAVERERELWAELAYIPAVKNDRVYLLQGDYTRVPGPRLTRLADDLLYCLYPDLKESR